MKSTRFGYFFPANPKTEWLPDGRRMRLLEDFHYVDPDGEVWTSLAGAIVDGASIPPRYWWLIGGPLEGRYRNASIPHDVFCEFKGGSAKGAALRRSWRSVHRMFYFAMRANGVGPLRAWIMWCAVHRHGPRWQVSPPPPHILLRNQPC